MRLSWRVFSSLPRRGAESFAKQGKSFEELTQEILRLELGMALELVGGAKDSGVDLRGSWLVGDADLVVVTQCKHYESGNKLTDATVREFEGAISRIGQAGVVGILSSNRPMTADAYKNFFCSRNAMMYFLMDVTQRQSRRILLNESMRLGLPQLQVLVARTANGELRPCLKYLWI